MLEIDLVCFTVQIDCYQQEITPGMANLSGNFLEWDEKHSNSTKTVISLRKDITNFFKENILYPYVNIKREK